MRAAARKQRVQRREPARCGEHHLALPLHQAHADARVSAVVEVELVAVQQIDALAEAHVGATDDARREAGEPGHDQPAAQ